jgi:hypothetical protein
MIYNDITRKWDYLRANGGISHDEFLKLLALTYSWSIGQAYIATESLFKSRYSGGYN